MALLLLPNVLRSEAKAFYLLHALLMLKASKQTLSKAMSTAKHCL